jgi:hypothetical protein
MRGCLSFRDLGLSSKSLGTEIACSKGALSPLAFRHWRSGTNIGPLVVGGGQWRLSPRHFPISAFR